MVQRLHCVAEGPNRSIAHFSDAVRFAPDFAQAQYNGDWLWPERAN
jgi:hypothetical protein